MKFKIKELSEDLKIVELRYGDPSNDVDLYIDEILVAWIRVDSNKFVVDKNNLGRVGLELDTH